MTEPYYESDRLLDDGIRDQFRWTRFSDPRFMTIGILLVLLLVVASTRDPRGAVRGESVRTAHHVAATAVRTGLSIAGGQSADHAE